MKNIWLSHILNENTPLYGGGKDIHFSKLKSIDLGDSCNAGHLSMPFHSGTHVDVPLHFVKNGKSINGFSASEWIFQNPVVIELKAKPGQLIAPDDLSKNLNYNADFIIIKTGFENYRDNEIYWESSPGLSPDCADFLLDKYCGLKGVGFDFISISSLRHRNIGRLAHAAFLEKGILLFEDMSLRELTGGVVLKQIIALPLRIENGDGAPITIIGFIE